jgi:hypothetical protein
VIAARVGYAAKGVVYSVLGVLAIAFVLGEGGGLTDGKGAIQEIGSQPFGGALLWIITLGLFCYALWCAVRAILDPAHVGHDRKGIFKRIGYAFGAVWHVVLALYAAQLASGQGGAGGGTRSWVAELMSLPLGQVLVAIVGAITAGFGLFQIYKALANKLGDEFSTDGMSARMKRFACRIARVGIGARGLVFPVIGGSLIVAAVREQPGRAEGFGEALHELAAQPFGELLIGFVAAGLLAYGLYLLCIARYGRIPQPR